MARQQRVSAKRPGGADGVLDRVHLSHYTMNNVALEREIIDLFRAQLPILVDRIQQTSSPGEWKFATHTLKGSAAAIGACRLNDLAKEMEVAEAFSDEDRRRKLLLEVGEAAREFELLVQRLYCR
jgi:HPt (histidine-containing phosphotransfer) domain-containing protein